MAATQVHAGKRSANSESPWGDILYDVLIESGVRQMSYVPDAGHARLISLFEKTPQVTCNVLTTEEEGVALCAGAWAGGQASVLLMQSSGVGNCINMLSLLASCRMPFLTIVTMRGEWGEFNPWQVPMGRATPAAFELMGVRVVRVDRLEDLAEAVSSAASMAFRSDQAIAVLISQQLIGHKKWVSE